jgi:hypothetical protein
VNLAGSAEASIGGPLSGTKRNDLTEVGSLRARVAARAEPDGFICRWMILRLLEATPLGILPGLDPVELSTSTPAPLAEEIG